MGKATFQQQIANNQIDEVLDRLLDLLAAYLDNNKDKEIERIQTAVILVSGKYKSVQQDELIGIIDHSTAGISKGQVVHALITYINELPSAVFDVETAVANDPAKSKMQIIKEKLPSQQTNGFEYDVFISFAKENIEAVKTFAEKLRGYHVKVFMGTDLESANVADTIEEKRALILSKSKHFVIWGTPETVNAPEVQQEYKLFHNQYYMLEPLNRRIVVLKGQTTKPVSLPFNMRRLNSIYNLADLLHILIKKIPIQRVLTDAFRIQRFSVWVLINSLLHFAFLHNAYRDMYERNGWPIPDNFFFILSVYCILNICWLIFLKTTITLEVFLYTLGSIVLGFILAQLTVFSIQESNYDIPYGFPIIFALFIGSFVYYSLKKQAIVKNTELTNA